MYAASWIFIVLLTQIAPPVIVEEPAEPEEIVEAPPAAQGRFACPSAPSSRCPQVRTCVVVPCVPACAIPAMAPPAQVAQLPAPPKVYRNPRSERPFSINFNYAGPALIGFSVTAFVTPRIQLEAGLGPLTKYAGATYHFGGENPRKTWTPYTGLMVGVLHDYVDGEEEAKSYGTYVPFGVQYSGRGGFLFAVEGAWAHLRIDGESIDVPWFGLKFGYRF